MSSRLNMLAFPLLLLDKLDGPVYAQTQGRNRCRGRGCSPLLFGDSTSLHAARNKKREQRQAKKRGRR